MRVHSFFVAKKEVARWMRKLLFLLSLLSYHYLL